MNNFKKRGGFGGGFHDREKRDFGARNHEMFQATCASCGKPCEVPFKPNGKKPVYCNNCFVKPQDGKRFEKRDSRPSGFDSNRSQNTGGGNMSETKLNDVVKLLESLGTKLDKLISIAEQEKTPVKKAASTAKKAPAKKK